MLECTCVLALRPTLGLTLLSTLTLYTGCAARMMIDSALQFAPHSYRLWLVAAQQEQRWQDAAAVLQRGIVALVRAGGRSSGPLPEQQCAAALDLGLRLLQLLGSVGDAESREAQLSWAGADTGDSGQSLARRSKAALLQELLPHSRLLATLCCCCAYAAACGCLPLAAEHSLGYQQPQLAALLQDWRPPPADAPDASAAAACRTALVAGADSLGLLGATGQHPLQQERRLSQHQRGQLAAAHAELLGDAAGELVEAQSALLCTLLRLDRFAGRPATWGANIATGLLGEVFGTWGSQPGHTVALAAAHRQWQALTPQPVQRQQRQPAPDSMAALPQPPAELLLFLQEAVVTAAVAAASPMHPSPVLSAALRGLLHPAAVAALAAAVASSGHPQAAKAAVELLASWAVAYEAAVSGAWDAFVINVRLLLFCCCRSACSCPWDLCLPHHCRRILRMPGPRRRSPSRRLPATARECKGRAATPPQPPPSSAWQPGCGCGRTAQRLRYMAPAAALCTACSVGRSKAPTSPA